MKKISKAIGAIAIGLILLLLVGFTVFGQKDIPLQKLKAKYTTAASSFMPIMGMQVHYRSEGSNEDTLPLVLIHGTSSSLHTWDSLVNLLVATTHKRIIRLDLPAFGLTGPNPANNYTSSYYIRFLDSFLMQLHINRCILAGNSLGGAIAWQYTVAHPNKVNQLVLIDAAGYPRKNEKGSLGFKIASMPIINNLLLFITPKSLVKKSLETVFYDPSLVTEATVTRYHEILLREGNRRAALSLFQNRTIQDASPIKTITAPTLIIWGAQDQLIAVEDAYLFQKDLQNNSMVILKNVGHIPMEESPDAVAKAIKEFLK
ncbi:MAG: alpha/beta hydrolase [Chitinophagia bacterium]